MDDPQRLSRRRFLAAGAVAVPAVAALGAPRPVQAGRLPMAISSGNGIPAVSRAVALMKKGTDPLDAVVAGINIVEDDPDDTSVGYGGLPNERGIVELDASVMHGPSHKAGAVAALRNIRHPSSVALRVMRRTDHVLLVGAGALEFARIHGFKEEDLLTERARERWLQWKENLSPRDDWLDEGQQIRMTAAAAREADEARDYGTIHCTGINADGNIGSCTSTSGLSFKIPGRVGDSPIIGAGMFCDNEVGGAGATGRGEAAIQSCGSFQVVRNMAKGMEPGAACLETLKWVAAHTRRPDLLEDGRPNFNLAFYALRKDGAYGSACMLKGPEYSIHDGREARKLPCEYLYE